MPDQPILTADERRFLAESRFATLATLDPDGRPRLVPVCHIVGETDDRLGRPRLYSAIDEKPKASADPLRAGRVRDLLILPEAVILAHRWDEDWSNLGWVRVYGRAELLEPQPHERDEHAAAVAALRGKYPQYEEHRLEGRPIIRLTIDEARSWGKLSPI